MQDVEPNPKPTPLGDNGAATPAAGDPKPIRPAIDYVRRGAVLQRHPLVERFLDGLKTFAWVAPLTILIWIYAERKQSATRNGVTVPVEVRINAKDKIVVLKNPSDSNFIATLSGPQGSLQRVLDTLSTPLPGNHAPVQIVVDGKLSGDVPLSAQEYLRRSPLFAQAGIAVRDVFPATMTVSVLDMEDREVPVKAPDGIKDLTDSRFVPSQVTVRAPKVVFEKAAQDNRLYVTADLAKVEAARQPGHHDVKSIPVTPAFPSEYATLDQRAVDASFEVKRADAEATLNSVPIWPAANVPFWEKYSIAECPTSLGIIHVKGPQDRIDEIKSQTFKVVALLYVTPDDADGTTKRSVLKIDLPAGVTVTDDAEQYTINFRVAKRSTTE